MTKQEIVDESLLGKVVDAYLIKDNYKRICYMQDQIKAVADNRGISYKKAVNDVYWGLFYAYEAAKDSSDKKALWTDAVTACCIYTLTFYGYEREQKEKLSNEALYI